MKRIFIVLILGVLLIMTGCSSNQSKKQLTEPQVTPNDTGISQQRVFTLDELKNYNGQNGNPAYVAVDGVVYDVTSSPKWRNGLHSACSNSTYAGTDFSELIKSSPHGVNIMKKFTVIGTLQK